MLSSVFVFGNLLFLRKAQALVTARTFQHLKVYTFLSLGNSNPLQSVALPQASNIYVFYLLSIKSDNILRLALCLPILPVNNISQYLQK